MLIFKIHQPVKDHHHKSAGNISCSPGCCSDISRPALRQRPAAHTPLRLKILPKTLNNVQMLSLASEWISTQMVQNYICPECIFSTSHE